MAHFQSDILMVRSFPADTEPNSQGAIVLFMMTLGLWVWGVLLDEAEGGASELLQVGLG